MSSPLPPGESLRFNPPPNWPALPPGWTPPQGWVPDPSWPAPPAGWPLWTADPGAAKTVAGSGARMSRRQPGQRKRRIWPGVAAVAVAVALVAGGLVYLLLPSDAQSAYSLGKDFEVAKTQQGAGLVTGPTSLLTKTCTADLSAAEPSQRPAATGNAAVQQAAVQQWVQGCEAGYHQDHPHQLVQDGIMWGNGAKPCTGACSSRSNAAGESIAIAAGELPSASPARGTSAAAAGGWCADLMDNHLSQPLTASVEAQLKANLPAIGPATMYWDQGCELGYRAVLDPNSAVTVTGAFGAAPDVTVPPLRANSSFYVKTLIQGTGATMTASDSLVGKVVGYDWSGTTSKLVGSPYSPGLFIEGQLLPGLETALIGKKAGSRVLVVIPPADGFGSSGNSQEGVGANDTLVFVVDMISTFDTASVPGKQTSDGGGSLPTVTPPAAGSTAGPTIKIDPAATPPTTLQVKTLIKGTGPVVEKGDEIAVQYNGYIWRTGTSFQSSWQEGTPLTTPIGEGDVISGWDTGLVGQTAGSRVLLVIPPADGYGSAGNSQIGVTGTDTLVFVVDILAAT
jgi:FKBP-type peptidyl-prolyl cis-trans isomerase